MKLEGKTIPELVKLIDDLEAMPEHRNPPGSFQIYTKKCRSKTDAIARQITHLLALKRIAEGRPLNQAGYSGRQTNRL